MGENGTESLTPFPTPIHLDLKGNPGEVTFNSFEELEKWLEEIKPQWGSVIGRVKQIGAPGELIVKRFEAPVSQLEQEIASANEQFKQGENIEKVFKGHNEAIKQNLLAFASYLTLHPKSRYWQEFVKALQLNPHFGSGVLAGFIGFTLGEATDGFGKNFNIIQQFSLGFIVGREFLRVEFKTAEELSYRLIQLGRDWEASIDSANKTQKRHGDEFETLKSKQIESGNALLEKKRGEIDALIKTYETHLQLKAPAKYWTDKQARHSNAYQWALFVFVAVVCIGIFLIVQFGADVFAKIPTDKNGTIPFASAVLITIPAIAYFWLLRHIARLFVSNLKLASDAEQRATMITTFEALVHLPENKVTPDALILILQAIFRPLQSDGDDDAPPPNLLEIMRERMK